MTTRESTISTPPLSQVFVDPVRVRFPAVFADAPDERFGAAELCGHADADPSTWPDHRNDLLELGLVEEVETDARHARRLARLSEDLDSVLLDLSDPVSHAIGTFAH